MFKLFGRNGIVESSDISQLLNTIITPELENYGFKFNGEYKWASDKKDAIRKVISYQKLKGATGILTWGFCFDFVPSISGSSLRWNKTEKSSTLHLFEWPSDYAECLAGDRIDFQRVSHWGKNELKETLKNHFALNKSSILNWFNQACDLDNMILLAQDQIYKGDSYKIHHPNPEYILMFLYAAANETDKAMNLLNKLQLDMEVKSKLSKLINRH